MHCVIRLHIGSKFPRKQSTGRDPSPKREHATANTHASIRNVTRGASKGRKPSHTKVSRTEAALEKNSHAICNTKIWIPQPQGSPADGAATGRRVERGDPPGIPAARDRSERCGGGGRCGGLGDFSRS